MTGSVGLLTGRTAIVTGASKGIGRVMSERFAREGARVVCAARSDALLHETVARIAAAGGDAIAVVADASGEEGAKRIVESGRRSFGAIDTLVNNAGDGGPTKPVQDYTVDDWFYTVNSCLTSAYLCTRFAVPAMIEAGRGAIVNIASINGQNPAALVAAYNVAKAGVISLTRTLALELAAYGVRVNAVCPGPVYTEFNRTVMAQRGRSLRLSEEQMVERVRAAIPLGRWGEPADIANAVAFLCGPEAAWITGEVLRVSGGLEGVSAAPPKRADA